MAKEARALRDQAEVSDGPVSEVVTYTPGRWTRHP
jgi:hypothetical protein